MKVLSTLLFLSFCMAHASSSVNDDTKELDLEKVKKLSLSKRNTDTELVADILKNITTLRKKSDLTDAVLKKLVLSLNSKQPQSSNIVYKGLDEDIRTEKSKEHPSQWLDKEVLDIKDPKETTETLIDETEEWFEPKKHWYARLKENKTLPKIKTEILKDQSVQSCLKGDKVDLTLLHDKLAPDISGKKESFFKVLDEAFRFEDGAISRVFFHLEGGFLDGEPVVNLSKKDEEITKMELLISELLFLKAFHESSSRYDLRDVIYRSLKKINEQKKEIKEMDTLSTDVENFLSSEKDILISDDK